MIKINISTKKRMRTILFIVFLVITILIGRLGYIQLIDGKKLSELAYEQQTLDRAINPKRGTIYDSTGQVLAQSSTVETVTVNPGNIDENIKEKVAKKLSCANDGDDILIAAGFPTTHRGGTNMLKIEKI